VPPSGRALTTGISLTQFRIYGGEFTGDNAAMIIMDMGDTAATGGDFFIFGAYFAVSGNNIAAVEVRGKWNNVIFDGSRDEETFLPAPSQQDRGFLRLADGGEGTQNRTMLNNFRIHAYSDGDELGEIVRGRGDLAAGTIISAGGKGIKLDGSMNGVELRTSNQAVLSVTGDCYDVALHGGSHKSKSHPLGENPSISCGGRMAVVSGGSGAGVIVVYESLNSNSTSKTSAFSSSTQFSVGAESGNPSIEYGITESGLYEVDPNPNPKPNPNWMSGLYEATYAGDRVLLQATVLNGQVFASTVNALNIQSMSGDKTTGKLSVLPNYVNRTTSIQAEYQGTDDTFVVRKLG